MNLENYEDISIKLLFYHNNLENEYLYFIKNDKLFNLVYRNKTNNGFFCTIEKPLFFLSDKSYFEFNFKYLTHEKEYLGSFMCWVNTNSIEIEGVFFNDPLPDNMIINNFFGSLQWLYRQILFHEL